MLLCCSQYPSFTLSEKLSIYVLGAYAGHTYFLLANLFMDLANPPHTRCMTSSLHPLFKERVYFKWFPSIRASVNDTIWQCNCHAAFRSVAYQWTVSWSHDCWYTSLVNQYNWWQHYCPGGLIVCSSRYQEINRTNAYHTNRCWWPPNRHHQIFDMLYNELYSSYVRIYIQTPGNNSSPSNDDFTHYVQVLTESTP